MTFTTSAGFIFFIHFILFFLPREFECQVKIAKDQFLGLKNKDITDILADNGIDAKTQKTLEPREFDLLFDALTKSRQVDNIDDYLDGVTYIPSRLPKKGKRRGGSCSGKEGSCRESSS